MLTHQRESLFNFYFRAERSRIFFATFPFLPRTGNSCACRSLSVALCRLVDDVEEVEDCEEVGSMSGETFTASHMAIASEFEIQNVHAYPAAEKIEKKRKTFTTRKSDTQRQALELSRA